MICPACRIPMIVVERNKVELDCCTSCQGVWFDKGELELLLDPLTGSIAGTLIENIMGLPPAETTEKRLACPICRQKMKKADIGKTSSLIIDVCNSGHGFWFGEGETNKLIAQLLNGKPEDKDIQDKMLFFVGDTFRAGLINRESINTGGD